MSTMEYFKRQNAKRNLMSQVQTLLNNNFHGPKCDVGKWHFIQDINDKSYGIGYTHMSKGGYVQSRGKINDRYLYEYTNYINNDDRAVAPSGTLFLSTKNYSDLKDHSNNDILEVNKLIENLNHVLRVEERCTESDIIKSLITDLQSVLVNKLKEYTR